MTGGGSMLSVPGATRDLTKIYIFNQDQNHLYEVNPAQWDGGVQSWNLNTAAQKYTPTPEAPAEA